MLFAKNHGLLQIFPKSFSFDFSFGIGNPCNYIVLLQPFFNSGQFLLWVLVFIFALKYFKKVRLKIHQTWSLGILKVDKIEILLAEIVCGNSRILLAFRFYMKLVLTNLELHSVEILTFFCHSDFTWDQFRKTRVPKVCKF